MLPADNCSDCGHELSVASACCVQRVKGEVNGERNAEPRKRETQARPNAALEDIYRKAGHDARCRKPVGDAAKA